MPNAARRPAVLVAILLAALAAGCAAPTEPVRRPEIDAQRHASAANFGTSPRDSMACDSTCRTRPSDSAIWW